MLQKPDLSIVPDPRILQLVRAYAWLCNENSHASDEILTKALSQGKKVHPGLAYQVVVFTPIAFTRYMLRDKTVDFSTEYVVTNPATGAEKQGILADNPVFKEAYLLAPNFYDKTFYAVAGRSAEFKAINAALWDGSQLSDLVMSPPLLFSEDWMP